MSQDRVARAVFVSRADGGMYLWVECAGEIVQEPWRHERLIAEHDDHTGDVVRQLLGCGAQRTALTASKVRVVNDLEATGIDGSKNRFGMSAGDENARLNA
jgi:hypothetical protein